MYAVISDLHANLPALTAVFEDIDRHGVEEVICLGDIVGYGPFPAECLRLVRERATVTLLGNHDEALLSGPLSFSKYAHQVIEWTKTQLPREDPEVEPLWEFVADLPLVHERGRDLFVHGSPSEPTQEYLLPTDDLGSEKYDDVFAGFQRLCFVGHTHQPCVITPDRRVRMAKELGNEYRLDAEQAVINVGSVGQPRDLDPRSCYVLVEDDHVQWRRVAYDIDATVARLAEVGLPEQLARRLLSGK
ncbi:MAG: metallophosphoesterase family protein [Planctomycetes bacterium]|nr:metallophosphoesterase family protein [Planctomycetota bacterium]MCW8141664.1 metallophosphoesterase family protein [Planctomycetota bacterium]